jgi:hypothetical protein
MDLDQNVMGEHANTHTKVIEPTTLHVAEPIPSEDRDESQVNPLDNNYVIRSNPNSAATFGNPVKTRWFEYRTQMGFDSSNPFAPWKSLEEFQLVEWLIFSKLSQGSINRFLQLPIVSAPFTGLPNP